MSKSKEGILKESYERTFSSQKYEKSNLQHTYENVVKPAMDEYAKQQVMAYESWKRKSGIMFHIDNVTEPKEQLYNLFLQDQSQDKTEKK